MPAPGLSLVGFMDQASAANHLRSACIPADASDPAILAAWGAAQAKLGPAMPNAGNPDIQALPAYHANYIGQLQNQPWVATYLQSHPQATFQSVEIDPLLVYQFSILLDKAQEKTALLGNPPTIEQLLNLGLPQTTPNIDAHISESSQTFILRARDLNVRRVHAGYFPLENKIGIAFGVALPLEHVVRFNGRYYLHNGIHRAYAARKAGATHIPCIVRDVDTPKEAGIEADGTTFSINLLQSANPPTMGHFTQDRAYEVNVQKVVRYLHCTWSEHIMPE
jgi:ParB-like nuclease domain